MITSPHSFPSLLLFFVHSRVKHSPVPSNDLLYVQSSKICVTELLFEWSRFVPAPSQNPKSPDLELSKINKEVHIVQAMRRPSRHKYKVTSSNSNASVSLLTNNVDFHTRHHASQ
ncbi:hypothetical protein KC346_g41 [Hortaea werneckii]|nr:hypothetical protein KC346_g41 [Hortaea werneckii]